MKRIALFAAIFFLFIAMVREAQSQDYAPPPEIPWKMGLGFQVSSSNLFLTSFQSPDLNNYGRSWRIEPMIGFTYSDQEATYSNTSASLSLGVGTYMRWKVRAPFDNLYFTMGPRVLVTGYRTTSQYVEYQDTLPPVHVKVSSEYISTSLALVAGPEYAIDQWSQHFTIAGFVSLGGTIVGRAKESPLDYNVSTWSLNINTATGLVIRYYFR